MTGERWRQIEVLYHSAREHGRGVLAGVGLDLRREVERLLDQDSSGGILDRPAAELFQSSTNRRMAPGAQLGPYRIEVPLGAGGMGEVFRAIDTRLGRAVAVKICREEFGERFHREARAIASLNHPCICTLYDIGPNFLVMELVEGETLAARLKRGKLSIEETIRYGSQIADALTAAQAKGIIHRDLKPGNIMLTDSGIKVLDFGLAKSAQDEMLSTSRLVMGTPAYMSPEQREGKECDARTDIYALGLVLYETATGRRWVSGSRLSAEMPPDLARIISKCLEHDRDLRYQHASEIRTDLQRFRRDTESERSAASAGVVKATGSVAVRKRSPTTKRWVIGLTAALIVIGLSAYWLALPLKPPRVLSSTQLTYDGLQKRPPVLTDGSRLFFAAMAPFAPYEISITGGEPARLATPNMSPFFFEGLAAISPDNSKLLLQSTQAFLWRGPLWVIPTVSGPGRRINVVTSTDAAWLPDGRRIVYASGRALYVADGDGTGSRQLVNVNGTPSWIRWSPDGRVLRFTLTDSQTKATSLWEVGANGSGLHPLLAGWNHPPAECCGTWTRDGKYFVFQSTHNFRSDIWAIQEKPGTLRKPKPAPVQLTSGPLSFAGPQPSYDGKKLFAIGVQRRGELVRYDAISKQFVPYLSGISADTLDFSRDGQWVTYVSVPEGTLWRSKLDGTEKLQLTFPPMLAYLPRWAPDGKRIVFQGSSAGKPWTMYITPADGGNLEEIRPWPGDPGWSPDGNSMVFSTAPLVYDPGASTKSTIQIMDLRSGQVSTLPDSEGFYSPRWSPDGRYIAILQADSNRLRIFDLSSRTWHQLGDVEAAYPNWSRDSRYIYFRSRELKPWLCRLRISDASLERIASLSGLRRTGIFGWTWVGLTPDSSPLVLRDIGTQEIYALDWQAP
jgi:eukaryotic-like serine/threonine-protein kinase